MKNPFIFICFLILPLFFSTCESYYPSEEDNEPFEFTDSRDGTNYTALKIGDQTWMIENLAYLPSVNAPTDGSESEAKYYVTGYQGTSVAEAIGHANYLSYGVLYNWTAAQMACPPGWHLPTDAEWQALEVEVGLAEARLDVNDWRGNADQIGYKMRSTSGWKFDKNGDNSTGFNALPAGSRGEDGRFHSQGEFAFFYTATLNKPPSLEWPFYRALWYNLDGIRRDITLKEAALSIRCVKN